MSDYEMIIKIEIQKTKSKPSDSINKCDDGSFRIVVPKKSAQSIDLCEQALLQTSFPAIREALSQHLSEISKEEAASYYVGHLKKTQILIK